MPHRLPMLAVFFLSCLVALPAAATLPGFLRAAAVEEVNIEEARAELEARIAQLEESVAEAEQRIADAAEADPPVTPEQQQVNETRLQLLRDTLASANQQKNLYARLESHSAELEEVRALRAAFDAEGLADEPPYTLARLDALEEEAIAAARTAQSTGAEIRTVRTLIAQTERTLAEAQQMRRRLVEESGEGAAEVRLAQLRERLAEQNVAMLRTRLDSALQREMIWNERASLFAAQTATVRPFVEFDEEGLEQRLAEIETRRTSVGEELRRLERSRTENERSLAQARTALENAQAGDDPEAVARAAERVQAREAWLDASNEGIQNQERRLAGTFESERMWQRRYAVLNALQPEEYEAWAAETAATRSVLNDVRSLVDSRINELRTAQLDLENRISTAPESILDPAAHRSRIEALEAMEGYARAYLTNIAGRQSLANRLSADLTNRLASLTFRERVDRAWTQVLVYWNYEIFVVDDRPFTLGRLVPSVFIFLAVLLGVWLARLFLLKVVLHRVIRDERDFSALARDIVLTLSKDTNRLFVLILAIYLARGPLPLSNRYEILFGTVMTVALLAQIGIWVNGVLQRRLEASRRKRQAKDPSSVSAYGLMSTFGRIAIASIFLLLIVRSLGQDITAVIAGLGIGGVAVAFALQNILGDIFCSVAILLDKPFAVGDFIVVGEQKGSVEHIGIKTTRIRSLSGEQIIFSNADLIGSRIQNFKRMHERRVGFEFGVVYETPREKLARIPGMVREIIEQCDNSRFDRSHFARFGDFSLDFETIYYVHSSDFAVYMDIQQQINLELFRRFDEEGISFAYPTRELILRGYPNRDAAPAPGIDAPGPGPA